MNSFCPEIYDYEYQNGRILFENCPSSIWNVFRVIEENSI